MGNTAITLMTQIRIAYLSIRTATEWDHLARNDPGTWAAEQYEIAEELEHALQETIPGCWANPIPGALLAFTLADGTRLDVVPTGADNQPLVLAEVFQSWEEAIGRALVDKSAASLEEPPGIVEVFQDVVRIFRGAVPGGVG